jgi:hypothetical protein
MPPLAMPERIDGARCVVFASALQAQSKSLFNFYGSVPRAKILRSKMFTLTLAGAGVATIPGVFLAFTLQA